MSRFDKDTTCERTICAARDPHLAGRHLDPRDELYDGPGTMLAALPEEAYNPAVRILRQAPALMPEVVDLCHYIERLRRQVAAAQVDKDRQVLAAAKRAEDCEHHGEEIRHQRHQAHWFSVLADANDDERAMWVQTCFGMVQLFQNNDPQQAARYEKALKKGSQAANRIRSRHTAPTVADCQRAGRCEHPDTKPHRACEQLTLFEVADV